MAFLEDSRSFAKCYMVRRLNSDALTRQRMPWRFNSRQSGETTPLKFRNFMQGKAATVWPRIATSRSKPASQLRNILQDAGVIRDCSRWVNFRNKASARTSIQSGAERLVLVAAGIFLHVAAPEDGRGDPIATVLLHANCHKKFLADLHAPQADSVDGDVD